MISSLRSREIAGDAGPDSAGGLPLGLELGRLSSNASEASKPPGVLRLLRPVLDELVLLWDVERLAGLPRRVELRLDDTPRLVLLNRRVRIFTL